MKCIKTPVKRVFYILIRKILLAVVPIKYVDTAPRKMIAHQLALDDDGDGIRKVHVNTIEGFWTGLRNLLRPFRGINKIYLQQCVAIHERAHNFKTETITFLRILCGVTYFASWAKFFITRRLSGNSNFFQNQGLLKKLPQTYSWYFEDNFLSITQSLGKRAFSDSLLVQIRNYFLQSWSRCFQGGRFCWCCILLTLMNTCWPEVNRQYHQYRSFEIVTDWENYVMIIYLKVVFLKLYWQERNI